MPIDQIIGDSGLLQRFQAVAAAGVMASLVLWWANRSGFFQLSTLEVLRGNRSLSIFTCLGAFLVFLLTIFVVAPLGYLFFYFIDQGTLKDVSFESIPTSTQGWYNAISLGSATLALLFYCFFLPLSTRTMVFGPSVKTGNAFIKGIGTWFISFPVVLFITQLSELLLLEYAKLAPQEQSAVKYVRMVMNDPTLLPVMLFIVIIVAPIAEEILFRGFFQSWLRQYSSRKVAIAITSVFFALCHFSLSQGWSNIELMLALFVLALFLGFLFEKEQSLWAPIGLHMTFNAVSIVAILRGWGE